MASSSIRNLVLYCVFSLLLLNFVKSEDQTDKLVRDLINQERAKVGAKPFAYNQILYEVSKKYADTMMRGNFFSHTGVDGSTMGSRIKAGGYTGWSSLAENIAKGQSSAQQVVTSWMNSPGHRANILNPKLNEMAVAHSASGWYWVQNFGERRGVQPPVAPPAVRTRAPAPAPAPAPGPKPAPTPRPTPKAVNPNVPANGAAIFFFQGSKFEQFKVKTYGAIGITNPTGSPFNVQGVTVPGTGFSVKYFAKFKAPTAGTYFFETVSDDGIRLTIGGVKAIENWTPHSATINRSGGIQLAGGATYHMKVEYCNYGGAADLQIFYQPPGARDSVRLPLDLLTPDNRATHQSK